MSETETGKLQPITLPRLSILPMMGRLLESHAACYAARLRLRSTGGYEWVVAHRHCSIRMASLGSAGTADDVAAEVWLDPHGLELTRRSLDHDSAHALIYREGAWWLQNDIAWIRCASAPADWPANIDDLFDEPWCDHPWAPWLIGVRDLCDLAYTLGDFGDRSLRIGLTSSMNTRIECGPMTALLSRRIGSP